MRRPPWKEFFLWGVCVAILYSIFAAIKTVELVFLWFAGDQVHRPGVSEFVGAMLYVPACGFTCGCAVWLCRRLPLPGILKDSLSGIAVAELMIAGVYLLDRKSIQNSIENGLNPFVWMVIISALIGPWIGSEARKQQTH